MFYHAQQATDCPKEGCDNVITFRLSWTPGRANAYGSFIVKCGKCGTVFDVDVGRDVFESDIAQGGELLDRYNKDIPGDRENTLSRHGLTSAD